MFRVIELQAKLDDLMVEHRSLADSASSPADDELRDISDTSFSSDRPPVFRPPLPPPPPPPSFFGYRPYPGYIPPFYGRRPPPPDRLHSPPAFDNYRGDSFVRESPRPRDVSPPAGRRPMPPEHHRSAPPSDNYRDEVCVVRSPPPRGNSPPDYERRDERQLPPNFGGHHHDERYRRHSPRARENSPQRRDRHTRRDRSRTPSDEESSSMPSSSSRVKSLPPQREERYQQSYPERYTSERNVDTRHPTVRSPPALQRPINDDDYPTY